MPGGLLFVLTWATLSVWVKTGNAKTATGKRATKINTQTHTALFLHSSTIRITIFQNVLGICIGLFRCFGVPSSCISVVSDLSNKISIQTKQTRSHLLIVVMLHKLDQLHNIRLDCTGRLKCSVPLRLEFDSTSRPWSCFKQSYLFFGVPHNSANHPPHIFPDVQSTPCT